MLNPTGANLGGKCGFVWGGTAAFCMVVAFFCLPEMKGYVTRRAIFRCSTRADPDPLLTSSFRRSYREIDILFRRRVSARQFHKTAIDISADE